MRGGVKKKNKFRHTRKSYKRMMGRTRKVKYRSPRITGLSTNRYIGGSAPIAKVAILFSGRIKGYENVKSNLESIKNTYNPVAFCSLNKQNNSGYIRRFCDLMGITEDRLKLDPSPKVLPILLTDPRVQADNAWVKGVKHGDTEGKEGRFSGAYSYMYQMKSVYGLLEEYQKRNNMRFDIVISYRADIDTTEKLKLVYPLKEMTLYVPEPKGDSSQAETWCDHGGLCNQVFYGTPDTMKIACELFDRVEELAVNGGVKYHCESLLKRHMEDNKIQIHRFPYFFSLHKSRHEPNAEANIN